MYRIAILLVLGILYLSEANAQRQISAANLRQLKAVDDSLQDVGNKMLDDPLPTVRLRADSLFTRMLVRALVKPYSFYFAFDSLQVAPVLYPPDSSFRIITWHVPLNGGNFRQKGVIQKNTPDGRLQMYPLFDVSDYDTSLLKGVRKANNWVGAVYYKIIQRQSDEGKLYTLLGYDENSDMTTRKWIDFLRFDAEGTPFFGGDFIEFSSDSTRKVHQGNQRFAIEYKKEGRAMLNFSEEENIIVADHLISETGEPEKKYTLIPGGDYEAFTWMGNKWKHTDKLFTEVRKDGDVPTPALLDSKTGTSKQRPAYDPNTGFPIVEEEEAEQPVMPPPAPKKPAKKPAPKKKNG